GVRAFGVQLLLQGRIDHVVRRGDDFAERTDAAEVITESTKRADVGHGTASGSFCGQIGRRAVSYEQEWPMNARAVVEANLRRVKERIFAACGRAGRSPDEDGGLGVVAEAVGPE